MRILCLESGLLAPAFQELGHDCLIVGAGCGHAPLDAPMRLDGLLDLLRSRDFLPDMAVWLDCCKPPSLIGLERAPFVTVMYSIDQYFNPWHVPFSAGFDHVCVAQKDYLPLFLASAARPASWLPLFAHRPDPALIKPFAERDVPVGFVGTVGANGNPERAAFLKVFRAECPLVATQGDWAALYGRSRIVVNQSAVGELNFRLFEAAACGAAVLTEDVDCGLLDLFVPGRDLLVYPRGDAKAAAWLARQALESLEALAEMALSGQQIVRGAHDDLSRARVIVAHGRRLLAEGAREARLARMVEVDAEMAKSYAFLAGDGELPLSMELRTLYAGLAAGYALRGKDA